MLGTHRYFVAAAELAFASALHLESDVETVTCGDRNQWSDPENDRRTHLVGRAAKGDTDVAAVYPYY